jgi:primase-polymerase (primpol)-like protein
MKRNNIPAELRALPQWVVANENKIPHNPRTGATASVVNPATWGTYEEACKANHFKHIGFVLADHNNLTIIDLDDKPDRPASPEQKELQKRILAEFQSYTERSQSGTGYHIIVRGHIPAGVHKDSIEIYSSGRYMICTGDVIKQLPVNNYQGHLDNMFMQMRPQEDVTLVQVDSEVSDADIVDMATNASNGEKFTSLCKGDTAGYPGQSEADLAVMSILAFYTKDNEQVMRIFLE